jgi:hypothetical protein
MKVNMIGYTEATFNANTRAALRSSLATSLAVSEDVIELGATEEGETDEIVGETDSPTDAPTAAPEETDASYSYGSADDEGGSAGSYGSSGAGIDEEDSEVRRLNVHKHLAVEVVIRAVHGAAAQALHTDMTALQTIPQLTDLKDAIQVAVEAAGDAVPTGFAVKIPTVGAVEDFVPPSTYHPTASPTDAPTDSPTAVPEETAEKPAEEVAATLYPTFAPTEAPVIPDLPVFDADDAAFSIIASTPAVADISAVEAAVMAAPTSSPTYAGYVSVAVVKEVKTVKATVGFPLTQAEATNPVMKLAIETGVASSLGLPADLVTIISAGGEEVRRRLVADLDIEFEIQSPAGADATQADKLKDNLGTVATSGALVANVQKSAADAGVLVAALKEMPRELAAPLVVVASKSVTVFEQQRFTNAPTDAPTAGTVTTIVDTSVVKANDMPIILGGVFGGLAALLICVFFATRSGSSGAGEPTLTPKGQQDQTRV